MWPIMTDCLLATQRKTTSTCFDPLAKLSKETGCTGSETNSPEDSGSPARQPQPEARKATARPTKETKQKVKKALENEANPQAEVREARKATQTIPRWETGSQVHRPSRKRKFANATCEENAKMEQAVQKLTTHLVDFKTHQVDADLEKHVLSHTSSPPLRPLLRKRRTKTAAIYPLHAAALQADDPEEPKQPRKITLLGYALYAMPLTTSREVIDCQNKNG